MQIIAEKIYTPFIIYNLCRALIETNAKVVIDTQVIGTKAIVKAVKLVNWFNRHDSSEPIKIIKVMTDLPTKYSQHFYSGFKKLSDDERALMTIESLPPILKVPMDKDPTKLTKHQIQLLRNKFWKSQLGSIDNLTINYTFGPIRPAFLDQLDDIKASKTIKFIANNKSESEFIFKQLNYDLKSSITADSYIRSFELPKVAKMGVISILLGSTGSIAILEYIKLLKDTPLNMKDTPLYIFLFCGRHSNGDMDLYTEVVDLINYLDANKSISPNINFIPLGFQGDMQTASILYNSQTIIARPGGLLSMELLQIYDGSQRVLLHSACDLEKPYNKSFFSHLLEGLTKWEKGNAKYLIELVNADLISPQNLIKNGCVFISPLKQLKRNQTSQREHLRENSPAPIVFSNISASYEDHGYTNVALKEEDDCLYMDLQIFNQ
jgi:hypothetical protein